MDITVRRLGQGDESMLVDIVGRYKARAIEVKYAAQLLANPLNFLLIAEHEQRAVGFVWGYLLQRLDRDKQQLFVYEVEVSPSTRKTARRSLAHELHCCLYKRAPPAGSLCSH